MWANDINGPITRRRCPLQNAQTREKCERKVKPRGEGGAVKKPKVKKIPLRVPTLWKHAPCPNFHNQWICSVVKKNKISYGNTKRQKSAC